MTLISANSDNEWYLQEDLLTLGQLARRVGVNPATAWRWYDKGCYSKKGIRCRLEGCRRGGRNVTSLERYHDFVRRLNDDDKRASDTAVPLLPRFQQTPGNLEAEKDAQASEATRLLKVRGFDC